MVEALPAGSDAGETRIQRPPGERGPDIAGYPVGSRAFVVHKDNDRFFQRARMLAEATWAAPWDTFRPLHFSGFALLQPPHKDVYLLYGLEVAVLPGYLAAGLEGLAGLGVFTQLVVDPA